MVAQCVALCAILIALSISASPADSARPFAIRFIGGHPITPPPSSKLIPHLPQFWLLLSEYQATAFDARVPFGMWLVIRGVVDPETHAAMMALYMWYLSATQRAVHSAE